MADNRQFADHVELGGANVYFKEEPTTGTTMPNTSYFKTEDVDGKPVKISRDNIMGIVKECLGTILNGGSDQTTVTKVPTLNGNTLGASAVSTLASVLGAMGFCKREVSSGNIDNMNLGVYNLRMGDEGNTITGYPAELEGTNSLLISFPSPLLYSGSSATNKSYTFQVIMGYTFEKIYVRLFVSTWLSWKSINL